MQFAQSTASDYTWWKIFVIAQAPLVRFCATRMDYCNKKHLKNVGPIRQFTRCRHCTVARRLRIDVHNDDDDDDNDNA